MTQIITVSKSLYDHLLERIARLEKVVFKNSKIMHAIDNYKEEKEKGKLRQLKKIDELFI